jgi:hypothetical protein
MHDDIEAIPGAHGTVLASIRKMVFCIVPVRHNLMRM